MKEKLYLILIWIFTVLICLQAGWIIRDRILDDTRDRVTKLEGRVRNIHGELVVEKGPVKNDGEITKP